MLTPSPTFEPLEPTGPNPLPCDPEAEIGVVGLVLFDNAIYDLANLKPSDFYRQDLGLIWQAYGALRAKGEFIDDSTTEKELVKEGTFDDATARYRVVHYYYAEAQKLNGWLRKIREWVERRRMLAELAEQTKNVWDENFPILLHPSRPRITRRTAEEALQPRPPIEWVVEPVISRGSLNIFYGEPGAKKTYSLLSMGVCVASGRPWLDMPTRATKVLFIDEESGESRFSMRLAAALRGELAWEETPFEFICLAGFHLDDPADVRLLENEILESGAGLVIFDALADLLEGDENSKQDTQPVLNALRRLAENTGAALCIIHHSNKMGGYRGSSAIKGAVDLMVQVTSEDGSEFVNFKSEKNRDGAALNWAAKATWIKEPESFTMIAAATHEKGKTLSKSQEYVIRYLTEHGASPLPEIMTGADTCTENAARQAVFNLANMGKLRRTNPGVRPAIYELTQEKK